MGARKGTPSTRCFARCSQAESPGIPRCGCILSVSVSCRTRSRRPTPARPAPGSRCKGKDFRKRGVEQRFLRCSAVRFATRGFLLFFLGKEYPCFNAGGAFMGKGGPCINTSGLPGCLQAAGPGDAGGMYFRRKQGSKRAGPAPVPCVRKRCAFVSHRRWKGRATVLPGFWKGQISLCVAETLSVQALESPAQGHPGGPRLASAEESGMITCFSRYVIFFFITIRIRYAGYHKKRRGAAHHGS